MAGARDEQKAGAMMVCYAAELVEVQESIHGVKVEPMADVTVVRLELVAVAETIV